MAITETERDGILEMARRDGFGLDLALVGQVRALQADTIAWHGRETRLVVHDGHAPGHGAVFLPDCGVPQAARARLRLPGHGRARRAVR
jgi:hypothetical protein